MGIFVGLIFGFVGLWAIREAKKIASFTLAFLGAALLIYPYFVSDVWWSVGIGLALTFWAFQIR